MQEPKAFPETGMTEVIKALAPDADCVQQSAITYQVLSDFNRQGRLQIDVRYVPGQAEGLTAPKAYFSLRKI